MNKNICCFIFTLLTATLSTHAVINPGFTPVDLVSGAELVYYGKFAKGSNNSTWQIKVEETIVGPKINNIIIRTAGLDEKQQTYYTTLIAQANIPVFICQGKSQNQEKAAYLYAQGIWFKMSGEGEGKWVILNEDSYMFGTFSGGADMLGAMASYIIADKNNAIVPTKANVEWYGDPLLVATLPGPPTDLAVTKIPSVKKNLLFAGSPEGDRLFVKSGRKSYEDVTESLKLDSKSEQFIWLDLNLDGVDDLLSWNGKELQGYLFNEDHFVHDPSYDIALDSCLNLVEMSSGNEHSPGIVVGREDGWRHLTISQEQGTWAKKETLVEPEMLAETGMLKQSLIADFNMDGYTDIIQLGADASILWLGQADGFAQATLLPMKLGSGGAQVAMADFDNSGTLDIFIAATDFNALWEVSPRLDVSNVVSDTGSLGLKCEPGATLVKTTDLNHNGRADLMVFHPSGMFQYHFNRGFRTFAEEGEVQVINGTDGATIIAALTADMNGDGSLDLAIADRDGHLAVYSNDIYDVPGLKTTIPEGKFGPYTVSIRQAGDHALHVGVKTVNSHTSGTLFPLPNTKPVIVEWSSPETGKQSREIEPSETTMTIVLE